MTGFLDVGFSSHTAYTYIKGIILCKHLQHKPLKALSSKGALFSVPIKELFYIFLNLNISNNRSMIELLSNFSKQNLPKFGGGVGG